ncbi:MAG: hypothetical protein ACI4E1_06675 [Lachnospira sp.]
MYICEYCESKIDISDKVCPTCGAPVSSYIDVDGMDNDVKANSQKISKLEKDLKNMRTKKGIKRHILLVAATIIGFIILVSVITAIYESIEYTDENLKVPDKVEFMLEDNEYCIPMKVSDFIEQTGIKFQDEYIINAKSNDYIRSIDYSVSLNVYNIDDTAKNYTECYIGSVSLDLDDLQTESFELMGIKKNTTYKQAKTILGKASYGSGSSRNKNATWYTKNGWIGIYWRDNSIYSITISNYRMLDKGYYE